MDELEALLASIGSLPLSDRLLTISDQAIRAEHVKQSNHLSFINFTKITKEGPGKAGFSSPISDFDLNDDEGFGHETAVAIAKEKSVAIVQYNHNGPRANIIREYLNRMAKKEIDESFFFVPILKEDERSRLDAMKSVKKLEVSVFIPGVISDDEAAKLSITKLLDSKMIGSAETLTFSISAGRQKNNSLSKGSVMDFINDLLSIREDVKKIRINGEDESDAGVQVLDLLNARLEMKSDIKRRGRRYSQDERFIKLQQAYAQWHKSGQLD